MATDTARVQLELASGRNELTAPFHETAPRRRKQFEPGATSAAAPASAREPTQVVFDVPLAIASQLNPDPEFERETAVRRPASAARPPWIPFIAALVAVAVGVWWVMSQRMPDIDPREVIARNLDDARAAMADGRYTDPQERSAFHYYSTVLALDPNNADAVAGIDAIADRHLTDARVSLSDRKIAEAGVALEKARRVRPQHRGLAPLDAQWRAELQKMIGASTVVATPVSEPPPKSTVAKLREAIERSIGADSPKAAKQTVAAASKTESSPPLAAAGNAPDVTNASAEPTLEPALGTTAVASTSPPTAEPDVMTPVIPSPEPQPVSVLGSGANIVAEPPAAQPDVDQPAAALPAMEPKLIRMVQPEYPQEALMRGLEGWVDVSLQVSPAGDVLAARVEESSRGRMFNRAALNAVQQWKYEPRSDGATSERVRVRLQFRQSN